MEQKGLTYASIMKQIGLRQFAPIYVLMGEEPYYINKIVEALDMGCPDYFDSGNLCLIEWPENIAELLPDDTVAVRITVNDDESRSITIE